MPEHSPGSSSRVRGAAAHSLRPYTAGAGRRGSDTVGSGNGRGGASDTRVLGSSLGRTLFLEISPLLATTRWAKTDITWGHSILLLSLCNWKFRLEVRLGTALKLDCVDQGWPGRLDKNVTAEREWGGARKEQRQKAAEMRPTHTKDKRGSLPGSVSSAWLHFPPALPEAPLCWCSEPSLPPGLGYSRFLQSRKGNGPRWTQKQDSGGGCQPQSLRKNMEEASLVVQWLGP